MNRVNQPANVRRVRRSTIALFVGPWIVGVVGLVALPAAASFVLSMTRFDGANWSGANWTGLENYRSLILLSEQQAGDDDPWYVRSLGSRPRDGRFYKSAYNTLVYSCTAAPLSVVVALFLASLLRSQVRGVAFFRTLFYIPHILAGVSTILVWSWIFNPRFGPVNAAIAATWRIIDPLMSLFGASSRNWPTPGWLMSPVWCKPAVIVMNVWTAGAAVFVFLAAMARIDPQLHSAARLDGATAWRRFRFVTVPLLTPVILFNLLTGLSASMQAFNQSYLLQNRAQEDGLLFCPLLIYQYAFEPPYRFGYASAMSWILFALLLVLGVATLVSAKRWVYYEN